MKVTEQHLKYIMPHGRLKVSRFLPYINRFASEFGITTPLRMAHYLAQIAHESGELRYTQEIADGSAYEGRKDLGNVVKGDGTKYKGRGLIQLTGRSNYAAYAKYCGYDVVMKPELLSQPLGAVRSSMWYWQTHDCNGLADADDVVAVTKRINGGLNGFAQRKAYLAKAKKALGI